MTRRKQFWYNIAMLQFRPIELSDREDILRIVGKNESRICEYTDGLILSWDKQDGRSVCIENDTLYLYGMKDGRAEFNYPIGPDPDALQKVKDFCLANNLSLSFSYMSEEQKEVVEDFFSVKAVADRDWADYIYLSEDLRKLSGKKYHGQKNHVNSFLKKYPDHVFLPYEIGLIPDIKIFAERFYAEKQSDNKLFLEDKALFYRMLEEAPVTDQKGGALIVGGEVVAVSFGEVVGDTLYVHYEKALRSYSGSYATVNYLFVNRYGTECAYVNREEDCGDEGLRKAKLALHPIFLAEKYFVDVNF